MLCFVHWLVLTNNCARLGQFEALSYCLVLCLACVWQLVLASACLRIFASPDINFGLTFALPLFQLALARLSGRGLAALRCRSKSNSIKFPGAPFGLCV